MNTIGNRLRFLITEISEGSQQNFANRIGVSKGTLSKMLKQPDDASCRKALLGMHRTLGVNLHWYLTGEGEVFEKSAREASHPAEPKESERTVPVIEQLPPFADEGGIGKVIPANPAATRSLGARKGSVLAVVQVTDNDMAPHIRHDELVLVNPVEQRVGKGGVFWIRLHGEGTVRRIEPHEDGKFRVTTGPRDAQPLIWDGEDEALVKILGRVLWKCSRPLSDVD